MRCRECIVFLADYIAEELPGETRETFEAHLVLCSNCRVFLDQYRETIVASRVALATEESPSIALPEDLVRAILKALDKA
jgi:predicted anti-sigma-YlaC factor YlaD